MKKGFTITSRLNDQSKTERMKAQEAYAVEWLPLDKIIPCKHNPYRLNDLEILAESIEVSGLLTPLTVRQPNAEGQYEIISGHRRYAACRMLLEEGHQAVAIIPALIAREGGDAYSRLQLLQANSTTRELTAAEKVMQVSEMKAALVQMKSEKHPSLEGKRVRERLAELLEVSPAQAGIMEQIDKNLSPGLKDAFQAGDMGMVQARKLSRLPEDEQEKVLEGYRAEGKGALKGEADKNASAGGAKKERQAIIRDSPWVPCAERMPEEMKRVLLFSKEGQWVFCGQLVGECFCGDDEYYICKKSEVSHWMPLPEPPEGAT